MFILQFGFYTLFFVNVVLHTVPHHDLFVLQYIQGKWYKISIYIYTRKARA